MKYREGQDLGDLLGAHLDVAGRLLPDSALALASDLKDARAEFDLERRNAWELLAELRESSIRRHQIAARRARAALAMLNQGWASCVGQLRMVSVSLHVPGFTAARVAADVEALAGARAQYAFHCEGLIPGVSEVLSLILYGARKLHAAAGLRSMLAVEDGAVETTAQQLRESIEILQSKVAVYSEAERG